MKKQFKLQQLFAIIDGRVSMDDIYDILNHVTDDMLMTHVLGAASKYLKEKNPQWLKEATAQINAIKVLCPIKEKNKEQFNWLMGYFLTKDNPVYDVPQLKDEFDTDDYNDFMVKNNPLGV